jgi:NDP-sugar pyrophosphorylase family protein
MSKPLPPLALLAGGLATRMRPITANVPKSMIEVAGRPFIAHQLELLAGNGVRDVVICCGFLGEQIEAFVGDGAAFGCSVRYSYDGSPLKGTGGALRRALPLLGDTFFVMYGDSYLPVEFEPVYDALMASGRTGLMTVFRNDDQWDRSNVEFAEGRILRYDKQNTTPNMHYIDYGLGMLKGRAFASWSEEDVFDLATVYQNLLEEDELAGYEVSHRFYEIGTPAGLLETDAFLRSKEG